MEILIENITPLFYFLLILLAVPIFLGGIFITLVKSRWNIFIKILLMFVSVVISPIILFYNMVFIEKVGGNLLFQAYKSYVYLYPLPKESFFVSRYSELDYPSNGSGCTTRIFLSIMTKLPEEEIMKHYNNERFYDTTYYPEENSEGYYLVDIDAKPIYLACGVF